MYTRCMASVGIFGKHWDEHRRYLATEFHEVELPIIKTEKSDVSVHIFKPWECSLSRCCVVKNTVALVDAARSDLHKGVKAAVTSCFPNAEKVLDWAQ